MSLFRQQIKKQAHMIGFCFVLCCLIFQCPINMPRRIKDLKRDSYLKYVTKSITQEGAFQSFISVEELETARGYF